MLRRGRPIRLVRGAKSRPQEKTPQSLSFYSRLLQSMTKFSSRDRSVPPRSRRAQLALMPNEPAPSLGNAAPVSRKRRRVIRGLPCFPDKSSGALFDPISRCLKRRQRGIGAARSVVPIQRYQRHHCPTDFPSHLSHVWIACDRIRPPTTGVRANHASNGPRKPRRTIPIVGASGGGARPKA
jgi:hypothetical protein